MAAGNRHALILAGGRGTRFWPHSRRETPKQLSSFLSERTLLQETYDRLRVEIPPERIWVLTTELLRRAIIAQLPEVPRRQVLAEPAQRNTAPAIGLAAQVLDQVDPDSVLGIFPADHLIGKPKRFLRLARAAYREAAAGNLVVLGIQPRWPETGYGYIEFPKGIEPGSLTALPVHRFREKPDLATAKRFLRAGHFCWNSGMFFWRASVFLDAFRKFVPRTASLLASLPRFGNPRFSKRLAEVYPRAENISVDYAVIEKASNVVGLASDDIGWNDLGSWRAVYEVLAKDRQGNVAPPDSLLLDSSGNYVRSPKTVALVGVEDLVVIDTPDALLVARREDAQKVGDVVKLLEKRGRGELL